jgi:acyl-CoA synthetase (AMP-forming)/AMP-acid ligase II
MILVERHERADLDRLEAAWGSSETFAFLPEKSAVSSAWVSSHLESLPERLRSDHFALLTSGSTGQPKLVIGSKSRAEALARKLHDIQDSEPVAETVLALPLTYCYAFVNQWLWARTMRRALVHTRGFSQPDLLRSALQNANDAMVCLVGIQVPLFAQYFPDDVFAGVTRVHFAGGRFPQSQLDLIRKTFPSARVFNNYGCAEAMPRLTIRPAEAGDAANDIGLPIPGVQLRAGANSEIEFQSAYAAVAFIDEAGFHPVQPDAWLRTGDLGALDDAGHWRITGRAGEVFKRHGEKVALPPLIEATQEAWKGSAVFYRERDVAGEEGHVLMLAPSATDDEVRGILQRLRSFPRAHWPLRIESVPVLATLPNGKVDVAALASLSDKTVHWRQRL